ncbi:hypothetical protein [Bacillus sp. 1P02SD]|uniref:hypothetical protein n=1 Tax=Bacillus sp. 1P02SD TaxID=3132264 RepID=UPI0039A056CB
MKKLLVVPFIFVAMLLQSCSAEDTLSTWEEVNNLATEYLKAYESKDINKIVKISDDIRFPDKIEQKKQYEDISSSSLGKLEIKGLLQKGDKEFEITFNHSESSNETPIESTHLIKLIDGEWRIIVGQDSEV